MCNFLKQPICVYVLLTVAASLASEPSQAAKTVAVPRYTIADLGTRLSIDPQYLDMPIPLALNNRGDVAGSVVISTKRKTRILRAAVMHAGQLKLLPRLQGFDHSYACGINDYGDVAGYGENVDGSSEPVRTTDAAFIWRSDGAHPLPGHKDDMVVSAWDINNNGEVVGYTRASDIYPVNSPTHPIIWRTWQRSSKSISHPTELLNRLITSTLIPTLTGIESYGMAINNHGWIVGYAEIGASDMNLGPTHVFLWKDGELSDLGALPDPDHRLRLDSSGTARPEKDFECNMPASINDRGDVVGFSYVSGMFERDDYTGFLYRGKMTSLGPGKPASINNNGEIVGEVHGRAVIWIGSKKHFLDDLLMRRRGWHLEHAQAINDRGQIAGFGVLHGHRHTYLLTPLR